MWRKVGVGKVPPGLRARAPPWTATRSPACLRVFKNAQELFFKLYFSIIARCLMFNLVVNHVNGKVRRR